MWCPPVIVDQHQQFFNDWLHAHTLPTWQEPRMGGMRARRRSAAWPRQNLVVDGFDASIAGVFSGARSQAADHVHVGPQFDKVARRRNQKAA